MKKHGLRMVVAALALAGVLTVMVASSAFALGVMGYNGPAMYNFSNGYTAAAHFNVQCQPSNRIMTLWGIKASVMGNSGGYSGWAPGFFDNGQYVSYNVLVRVDNGGETVRYSWSPWMWIKGGVTIQPGTNLSSDGFPFLLTALNPRDIVFSGLAGHTYHWRVQVTWYTGGHFTQAMWPVNVEPDYTTSPASLMPKVGGYTWYPWYPWGGYTRYPTSCAF